MVRLNSLDPRAPTLSPSAVRVVGFQVLESELSAAGTWDCDVRLPAYALLMDVFIHAEEVWTAGTTAACVAGLYTVDATTKAISTAEDANGLFESFNLLATDLTKGQSVSFLRPGGVAGAMRTEGSSSHWLDVVGDTERIVRVSITTTGTVTTALGETYVYVMYAIPEMDVAVAAAT